ncbi:hypothetical protein V490_07704 [Pseudogymnoascus sp. VKM F-3557]|nr:hypothetical protein V490_07704 [Pseudogymnoascus sp. VKM F-3557]
MADKAQFLVVPAYTAVVLTLLHDFGLDRYALSLDGWCRDGNGKESGKDESGGATGGAKEAGEGLGAKALHQHVTSPTMETYYSSI